MNSNIFNLMRKAQHEKLDPQLLKYAEFNNLKVGDGSEGTVTKEELADRINETQEYVYSLMSRKDFSGEAFESPSITINEAMSSSDASIIFPRVISEVLQEPKEPNLFLTNSVADVVELPENSPLTIEFPRVSAMNAYEMSENQDYRNENLAFTQDLTALRIKKIGVSTSLSEEVQEQSMWPLLKLCLRLMSAAIDRKVEATLFNALTKDAQVVFDNVNASTVYWTTGVNKAQAPNATFSYEDLVKLMGVLLGNRYEGTHFLAHPLAWPIFATNPILRSALATNGQLGAGIWNRAPQFDQSASIPFGLQYVPYYALPYVEQNTITNFSSLPPCVTTDLYLIDAKNTLFLAQRGKTDMDSKENWYRDCTQMKARKYVGIAVKDGGKGIMKAGNIRVDADVTPVFTVRTVAS